MNAPMTSLDKENEHHLSLDDDDEEGHDDGGSPPKRRKMTHEDNGGIKSRSGQVSTIPTSSKYWERLSPDLLQRVLSFIPYQQIVHQISLLSHGMRSLCVGGAVFGSQYIYLNDRAAIPAVSIALESSISQLQFPAFKFSHLLGSMDLVAKYLRIIEPFVQDLDMTELDLTSELPTDLNFSRLTSLRISNSSKIDLLKIFCKGDRDRFNRLELDSRGITILPGERFHNLSYANYGKLYIDSIEQDLTTANKLIELELPTILNTTILETIRLGCPLLRRLKVEISPVIAPEFVKPFPNLESLNLVCNLQTFQQFFADLHPKLGHLVLRIEQGDLPLPQDLSMSYITLRSLKVEGQVPLFLFQSFNCEQLESLKLPDTRLPDYLSTRFTCLKIAHLTFHHNLEIKSLIQSSQDSLTELHLKGISSEELNINNLSFAKRLKTLKLVSVNLKKPKTVLNTLRKELPQLLSVEIDNNQAREISFEADVSSSSDTIPSMNWNNLHLESKQFSTLSSSWFGNCRNLKKLSLITPKNNTFWQVSETLSRSNAKLLESVQVSFTATRTHPYFCFYVMPEHVKSIDIHFSNKYELREWLLMIICCHHAKRISFNLFDSKLITKSDQIPKKLLGTKYRKQLKNHNFWSTYLTKLKERLTETLQNENMLAATRDLKQQMHEEYNTIFASLNSDNRTTENLLASPKILERESIVFSVRYMRQFVNHSMESATVVNGDKKTKNGTSSKTKTKASTSKASSS